MRSLCENNLAKGGLAVSKATSIAAFIRNTAVFLHMLAFRSVSFDALNRLQPWMLHRKRQNSYQVIGFKCPLCRTIIVLPFYPPYETGKWFSLYCLFILVYMFHYNYKLFPTERNLTRVHRMQHNPIIFKNITVGLFAFLHYFHKSSPYNHSQASMQNIY